MRKLFLLIIVLLVLSSCGSKKEKADPLIGYWEGYGGIVDEINFIKTDSSYLANFTRVGDKSRYKVGQVLFKSIKKQSDSLFLGKGLFMKDIYRTETTWNSYWNQYEQNQVFDHYEYLDVDYKLIIAGDSLKCIPFSEGFTWTWIRKGSDTLKVKAIDESKLIKSRQLGLIKIKAKNADFTTNKPALEKIGKIFRESVQGEEGITSYIYKVMKDDKVILDFNLTYDNQGKETNIIDAIRIASPEFRTSKDIGVGSLLSDFIKVYPTNNLWYTYVSGMFVIETKELENVQFIIEDVGFIGDKQKLGSSGDMDVLSIKDFNPSCKIKSIRML